MIIDIADMKISTHYSLAFQKELSMAFNKEIWEEALNLTKDQLRHGKIHHDELEPVAKLIYEKLLYLKTGPQSDSPQSNAPQYPLHSHEKSNAYVKCAVCGKEFKTLTSRHLATHGFASRIEYMKQYNVRLKDMSIHIKRNVTKGDNNPLMCMHRIMDEFKIKKGEVKNFVVKSGYAGLKDLIAQSIYEKTDYIELIKLRHNTPK